MKAFIESLSLESGAILVAGLSVAIVWLLCRVFPGLLMRIVAYCAFRSLPIRLTGCRFGSALIRLNTVYGPSG